MFKRNYQSLLDAPHAIASSMISMSIPDPVFLKRKVSLAKDVSYDPWALLLWIGDFGLRNYGYCEAILEK